MLKRFRCRDVGFGNDICSIEILRKIEMSALSVFPGQVEIETITEHRFHPKSCVRVFTVSRFVSREIACNYTYASVRKMTSIEALNRVSSSL